MLSYNRIASNQYCVQVQRSTGTVAILSINKKTSLCESTHAIVISAEKNVGKRSVKVTLSFALLVKVHAGAYLANYESQNFGGGIPKTEENFKN